MKKICVGLLILAVFMLFAVFAPAISASAETSIIDVATLSPDEVVEIWKSADDTTKKFLTNWLTAGGSWWDKQPMIFDDKPNGNGNFSIFNGIDEFYRNIADAVNNADLQQYIVDKQYWYYLGSVMFTYRNGSNPQKIDLEIFYDSTYNSSMTYDSITPPYKNYLHYTVTDCVTGQIINDFVYPLLSVQFENLAQNGYYRVYIRAYDRFYNPPRFESLYLKLGNIDSDYRYSTDDVLNQEEIFRQTGYIDVTGAVKNWYFSNYIEITNFPNHNNIVNNLYLTNNQNTNKSFTYNLPISQGDTIDTTNFGDFSGFYLDNDNNLAFNLDHLADLVADLTAEIQGQADLNFGDMSLPLNPTYSPYRFNPFALFKGAGGGSLEIPVSVDTTPYLEISTDHFSVLDDFSFSDSVQTVSGFFALVDDILTNTGFYPVLIFMFALGVLSLILA